MPKEYRIMQVSPVEEQQFNQPPPKPPRPGEFPYMVQRLCKYLWLFPYWKDDFAASTLDSARKYIKQYQQPVITFTPKIVT